MLDIYVNNNERLPVEYEAVQLTKENVGEVVEWCGGFEVEEMDALNHSVKYVGINVQTFRGKVRASEGDYVLKDMLGEFHVSKPGEFRRNYKLVSSGG